MDFILKTTNLCKNFKGQLAVNHVSLNIPRNSVYGLLGLPDKRIDEVLHIVRLTDTGKKNEPENIFPSCLHPSA